VEQVNRLMVGKLLPGILLYRTTWQVSVLVVKWHGRVRMRDNG